MSFLTWSEKLMLGLLLVGLVGGAMLFTYEPPRRYRLPNGDVVECRHMVETSKGNFHLYGCEDGTEYYVTGSLEALK